MRSIASIAWYQKVLRRQVARCSKRQTEGSVICTSCGVLVGVNDATCYNCGRRNPGLWGFAPALRRLGNDLGFVPLVIGGTIILYVLSLVLSRARHPGDAVAEHADADPARRERRAAGVRLGRWWTVLTAGWLHGGVLHIFFNVHVDPPARAGDRQPVRRRADGHHLHRRRASPASRFSSVAVPAAGCSCRSSAAPTSPSARRRRSSACSARSSTTAGAPAAATSARPACSTR